MKRPLTLVFLAATLASCRSYDYSARVSQDAGLTPADRYARYGHEQAQLVAVGRELAQSGKGSDAAEAAVKYARTLPDVADATADSLGQWVTVRFKSGWRAATPPIADGKRGAETTGLTAGR